MQILRVANDNDIYLNNLLDSRTNRPVNFATVTFRLLQNAEVVQTGSLTYVPNSAGKYIGTLESTVAIVPDTDYILEITAVSDNRNGFWEVACRAIDNLS